MKNVKIQIPTPSTGITVEEAREITAQFTRDYPSALNLAYRLGENTAALYGPLAALVPSSMKAGYFPHATSVGDRELQGRVDVVLDNIRDGNEQLQILRHEVLGHYGVNTFQPDERQALLEGLIAARNEPVLESLWSVAENNYPECSVEARAEEVFALFCESVAPRHHVDKAHIVRDSGIKSFSETCVDRGRLMQIGDLKNIALMVASGLHDGSRTQRNFPEKNQNPRLKKDELKKPFHETVAEKLIEQLKAGTAPWQKPWEPGVSRLPMNPVTGKRYKGVNALYLSAQGHSDPRWMTYKQASSIGAQVHRGEKGTPVQYWKFSEEQNMHDENGKPVRDAEGKPVKETVILERPRVFFATVFNAEQIDGLSPLEVKEQTWDAVERAEHILKMSGADIRHGGSDRAFYRPTTDTMHLPGKEQFASAARYYATALHELGHWSGHESRLARDLSHPFGSEGYAREELRAEIASMIIGTEIGTGHDPNQHAAYVGSWIKALEDDPLEIFRASAEAEKIHEYVLAFEQKQVLDHQLTTQTQGVNMELTPEFEEVAEKARIEEERIRNDPSSTKEEILAAKEARKDAEMAVMLNAPDLQQRIKEETESQQANPQGDAGSQGEQSSRVEVSYAIGYASTGEFTDCDSLKAAAQAFHDADPEKRPFVVRSVKQGDRESASYIASTSRVDQQFGKYAMNPDFKAAYESVQLRSARTYIEVPYNEKDEAKELGAQWDRQAQSWYVPTGADIEAFAKWNQGHAAVASEMMGAMSKAGDQERIYLAVAYGERGAAKAAGALWDKTAKSWYVGPKADMERLQRWLPENVKSEQGPAISPREEFAEALRSLGCVVGGEHPVMDGKKHRIGVEGDKKGEQAGFYVGHLDGHPAGYIKNNRTGIDMKWKSKGYVLDPVEKAKLQAEAAAKLAERAAKQERVQEATAQRVTRQTAGLVAIEQPTPYLEAKGIQAHAGVLTDKEGQKTYLPAFDADGKQWTMQYIQEDGTKRFAKDSRKEGCFHPVGGMDAVAAAPVLIVAEGYATAAQLAEATGQATISAFDSGNLETVAKALHEKFPEKPVIIAGDDDRHLELTQGVNPGRSKAEAAAKAVGGKAIFPIFAPGENTYPAALPPITPQTFREHERAQQRLDAVQAGKVQLTDKETADLKRSLLSPEQLTALAGMKTHTDFNDLATRSELGREGVERQVKPVVDKMVLDAEVRKKVQKKEQKQDQQTRRTARVG